MEISSNMPRSAPSRGKMASIKRFIRKRLPDWCVLLRNWRNAHGAFPRIIRPITFNEKILHRNLFDRRELFTQLADKAAVRSYVEERIGPEILPKLYYLTSRPETIPFDELPNKFVVKPTHGCGWVQLVTDKSALDRTALIERCSQWLKQSYYSETREWIYKDIEPRIIVEELIDDGSGDAPSDYKLYVFDGTVKLVELHAGRFLNHRVGLYTPSWNKIAAFTNPNLDDITGDAAPPAHLAEMISVAEALGKDLDFVRADFYDTDQRLCFGELTMTPGAGLNRFRPEEFDRYLGGLWTMRTGYRFLPNWFSFDGLSVIEGGGNTTTNSNSMIHQGDAKTASIQEVFVVREHDRQEG